MFTNNKELRKIIREAESAGWRFFKNKRHIIARHADGVSTATISVSPSDHRVLMKVKRDLGV